MSDPEITTVCFDKPIRMVGMGGMSSALESKRLPRGSRIVLVQMHGETFVTVEGIRDAWHVPLRRVDSMKFASEAVEDAPFFDDSVRTDVPVEAPKGKPKHKGNGKTKESAFKPKDAPDGFMVEP